MVGALWELMQLYALLGALTIGGGLAAGAVAWIFDRGERW
jgi:hypothetical protein